MTDAPLLDVEKARIVLFGPRLRHFKVDHTIGGSGLRAWLVFSVATDSKCYLKWHFGRWRMKLIVAVLLALSLASPALAKNCTKGKPCGKSCIAVHKTCRK